MSEEAIYGLILVSGMIVVSGSSKGSSLDAFITVTVTVIVFYAAHVFSGTLGRLAVSSGRASLRTSLGKAARQSAGMVLASVPPLVVLLLGATTPIDDSSALWTALIINAAMLGALGWIAVARWNPRWLPRLVGAVTSAAFGGVLIALKAIIHH